MDINERFALWEKKYKPHGEHEELLYIIAKDAVAALSRLAAPKPEARTISWQLINDIIDETLEEESAPLECAIQVILAANGYTAINEPAAPEPRLADEPFATSKDSLQVEPAPASEANEVKSCHHDRGKCPGLRRCVGAFADCKPAPASIEDAIQASEVKKAMSYNGRAICDWKGARDTLAAEVRALRSQLAQAINNANFWMGENSKTAKYYEAQLARKDEGLKNALKEIVAYTEDGMSSYKWGEVYKIASAALREPDWRKGE